MYARIKATQVPKRGRKSESRFERTEEWRMMKADLDRGLKPQEALQVTFSEAEKEKIGISHRRTIARFVQKYLATNEFPYIVKSFHREGLDFVIVQAEQTRTKGRKRTP
jgi:hypothetical protein